jgi:glucose dehydrogenase
LNECPIYKLGPQSANNLHAPGAVDFGGTLVPTGKTSGFMAAVDTRSGKIAWKAPIPAPMVGGALATAGGLVFSGSEDGTFYAFDAASGQVRWKTNVNLAFGAAPLTYAVNGTQYLAVATGGAAVAAILGGKVTIDAAIEGLLTRPFKAEE